MNMNLNTYKHSVRLDIEKCNGCTTCLRHCPTEAIRIKDNHAVINDSRCIDCGECIRVCPNKAKKAVCGNLKDMEKYKWKIALPAPTLYGQFENLDDVDIVLDGLLRIGFDDVFEVSAAAEIVSIYTRQYLKDTAVKKPAISSACPVVLRLISLRFPSLEDNIIHLLPPMEVAAGLARDKAKREHPELSDGDIGVFFISPCPGKVSYVRNGLGEYKSQVDVVVSISDVYFTLINEMRHDDNLPLRSHSGRLGIGWAVSGGEATSIFNEKYLAADGIDNIIRVLDQVENGNIPQLDFIELNACTGGCVGGVMTIQNPFIAKARLQSLKRYLPVSQNSVSPEELKNIPDKFLFGDMPEYQPISMLSESFSESLKMLKEIEKLNEQLPGIDCGSCGAPNCRAFAEDVVKNTAKITDCLIMEHKKGNSEKGMVKDNDC